MPAQSPLNSINKKNDNLLIQKFSKLDIDKQRILEVLAIVYCKISQSALQKVIRQLNWKASSGRLLSGLVKTDLKEEFLDAQLIEEDNSQIMLTPKLIDYCTLRVLEKGLYQEIATAVQQTTPAASKYVANKYDHDNIDHNKQLTLRALRHAQFIQETQYLQELLNIQSDTLTYSVDARIAQHLIKHAGKTITIDSLKKYHPNVQILIILTLLIAETETQLLSNELYEHFELLSKENKSVHPAQDLLLIEQRLLRLKLDRLNFTHSNQYDQNNLIHAFKGWHQLFLGNAVQALEKFEHSISTSPKDQNQYLKGLSAVFYFITLLATQKPESLSTMTKYIKLEMMNSHNIVTDHIQMLDNLRDVELFMNGASPADLKISNPALMHSRNYLAILFRALSLYWIDKTPEFQNIEYLKLNCLKLYNAGYKWYAFESAILLLMFNDNSEEVKAIADEAKASNYKPLHALIVKIEPWQRTLNNLRKIHNPESENNSKTKLRMVWWLYSNIDFSEFYLQPREQKLSKKGTWSKGRVVSLQKLYSDIDNFEYLTKADKEICQHIKREFYSPFYYGHSNDYSLDSHEALLSAIGHPQIFWPEEDLRPVEIVSEEPVLQVTQDENKIKIEITPAIENGADSSDCITVSQVHPYRVRIVKYNHQHLKISSLLGSDGLTVPLTAKDQILECVNSIAPLLTVYSAIDGVENTAETLEANSLLQVHIRQTQDIFFLYVYVQPFAPSGPVFNPGQGSQNVFYELEGRQVRTKRNMEQETEYFNSLLEGFPEEFQENIELDETGFEWSIADLSTMLELLLFLKTKSEHVTIHWPEGQKLKMGKLLTFEDVSLGIQKQQDWFEISGQCTLNQNEVIEMSKLIGLLNETPGRFIKLEDGAFIAITEELKKKLEQLSKVTDKGRFHNFASSAIEEITDGLEIQSCQQWHTLLNNYKDAQSQHFQIPATLQAELRDYQVCGYQWMSQLSYWGAGACLADDMGLGKTLQALTLILSRAHEGPTLVIAPTSVCMNWKHEAQKFAPLLNVQVFSQLTDRDTVTEVSNYDLVICSYGLMQIHVEKLENIHWNSIILDEAQAIKNPQAKRTKAIIKLQGKFKLALTGTPIENHIGELWSLFRFINPGLLGSYDRFNQRFTYPIENNKDETAWQSLKKLTQPFILRRLKSQVLTELPSRTEININVELSSEEIVFYEALRQKAVHNIENHGETGQNKKFLILTELMKLRRACCSSSLVMPDSNLKNSKLEALGRILNDLLENNHKALIFSQFVDHLSLIRAYLDSKKICYQYLDGRTSVKKRTQAVADFQSGSGDVFLISLKAGGVGLNLTAADYVIHMDPWWNPAVEDQASDRAHRMGQQKPVTIYRLITSNTIEEKIVKLHEHKRDLATNLLDGSEAGSSISVEEMMELMQN